MKREIEQLRKEFNERIDALMATDTKFEVGKWYSASCGSVSDYLIRYGRHFDKSTIEALDFFGPSMGEIHKGGHFTSIDRPATPSEIESALIAEAKRRGFKEGVLVKGLDDDNIRVLRFKDLEWYNNWLCDGWGSIIFQDGQWAEIIKDEKIMVGGYEVKFSTCTMVGTTIDGHTFTKDFWQAAKLISEHSKAKIMVGCSKQFDVSLETINAILKKL